MLVDKRTLQSHVLSQSYKWKHSKNCLWMERIEKAIVITKKQHFQHIKKEDFGRELLFLFFWYKNFKKSYLSLKNTKIIDFLTKRTFELFHYLKSYPELKGPKSIECTHIFTLVTIKPKVYLYNLDTISTSRIY